MPKKAKKKTVQAVKKAAKSVAKKSAKKPSAPAGPAKRALKPREIAKALQAQKTAASKWELLYSRAQQIQTVKYNMKMTYERQTGLQHKTLGWGFILDNKNDRLEVLFKDGIKYLISNYK